MIKYFFVVPMLYLVLVTALLFNYLSEARKFSFRWGDMTITISPADDDAKAQLAQTGLHEGKIAIRSVKVIIPQMQFSFSSKMNMPEDKGSGNISYISELPSGEGFVLSFENDTYISFQTKLLNPKEIAILVHTPEDKPISFYSRVLFGYKIEENPPTFHLLSTKHTAKLLTSTNAQATRKGRRLLLSTNGAYASFHITENQFDDFPYISKIPKLSPKSIINTEKSIENYINKSYKGWTKDRLDTGPGTWKQPEGFYAFSESALLAMYRETISRNALSEHKLLLDKIMHRNANTLTWRSAIFDKENNGLFSQFFDFVQKSQRYALDEANKNNRKSIQNLDTWESLPFWNDATNIQKFLTFIKNSEANNMLSENATMLLYQSSRIEDESFQKYIQDNKHLLEQNIIHHTIVANDGYLVLDSKKNINIQTSILAGKYLSLYGSEYRLRLLGYRILYTVLELSDENGILPRIYVYTNTELDSLGYISPEEIYNILSNNDKPIKASADSNNTIVYNFSLSRVNVATQNNTMDIALKTEEKGITEFSYIWPIDKPREIVGFDAQWTGFAYPANFSHGIQYDANKKLLSIKLLSLADEEHITIRF